MLPSHGNGLRNPLAALGVFLKSMRSLKKLYQIAYGELFSDRLIVDISG
jgi:hypothetical protein